MKYILYARKSSEQREKQALSIPDQIAECVDYANLNKLNILRTIRESKSAFKPNIREQLDLMIQLIKEGVAQGILVWKPDRLCRNPEEGGKILQLLQDGVIMEIRTATGEIYSQESDHLILQIHFGMANQFSRNLSQNVRRGLSHKAKRGEYPRPAPYGYESYGDVGRKNIRPKEPEASFYIESCTLMASRNHSLGSLCNLMHQKGMRTKRDKRVSKSHMYSLLTCPTYYGYFLHVGELHEGNYEPLISKELHDRVQEVLQNRSKPKKYRWDGYKHYNGIIYCGECGCAITTTVKKKHYKQTDRYATYSYHGCTHRKGKCSQGPVTTEELEAMLLKEVKNISIDEEVWGLGIKLLKAKHKGEVKKYAKQLVTYQQRYNSLLDKLNRLIEMRAEEELTKEEFFGQKKLILEEQARVKQLMTDAEGTSHHWLELAENFLETAFQAREIMENGKPEDKRQLLLTVGGNLILKNKKVDISFKKPFDILLQPHYRTNVLGG